MKCATYKAPKNIMPYLIKITLVFIKEYLAKLYVFHVEIYFSSCKIKLYMKFLLSRGAI